MKPQVLFQDTTTGELYYSSPPLDYIGECLTIALIAIYIGPVLALFCALFLI